MRRKRLVSFALITIMLFGTITILANRDRWDKYVDSWTLLEQAAYYGNTKELRTIIQKGVDSEDLRKALKIAVHAQKYNSVKFLLENGAEFRYKSRETESPLILACMFKDIRIVKILVRYGADVQEGNYNGWTPIISAATFGTPEILEYLIKKNADINHQFYGMTALMYAVYNGYPDKVRILVQYHANKRIKDSNGDTVFEINKKMNADKPEIMAKIDQFLRR